MTSPKAHNICLRFIIKKNTHDVQCFSGLLCKYYEKYDEYIEFG